MQMCKEIRDFYYRRCSLSTNSWKGCGRSCTPLPRPRLRAAAYTTATPKTACCSCTPLPHPRLRAAYTFPHVLLISNSWYISWTTKAENPVRTTWARKLLKRKLKLLGIRSYVHADQIPHPSAGTANIFQFCSSSSNIKPRTLVSCDRQPQT